MLYSVESRIQCSLQRPEQAPYGTIKWKIVFVVVVVYYLRFGGWPTVDTSTWSSCDGVKISDINSLIPCSTLRLLSYYDRCLLSTGSWPNAIDGHALHRLCSAI